MASQRQDYPLQGSMILLRENIFTNEEQKKKIKKSKDKEQN